MLTTTTTTTTEAQNASPEPVQSKPSKGARKAKAPKPEASPRAERLGLLVDYVRLLPFITAMIALATKGGKKNAIGYDAALAAIGSPALTAFFAKCAALQTVKNNHFSADDIRIAGLAPDTDDAQQASLLVGLSVGAFCALLMKQSATRSDILRGARALGKAMSNNLAAMGD